MPTLGRSLEEEEEPHRPAYFFWLLANILAACFAIISWVMFLHVFGNPEIPRNYAILKKLERLPELKRYTVLDVPNGTALDPSELYGKYFGLTEEKRQKLNSLLVRNYMRNFESNLLLTYVEGDFEIRDARKLTRDDFLYPGFVVRAQAMVKPDDFTQAVGFPMMIEYIFPTENSDAFERFNAGDILEVNKNPNCAAVIHVSKAIVDEEPGLQMTVVPIAYGPYSSGGESLFAIEPPQSLNPASELPFWK